MKQRVGFATGTSEVKERASGNRLAFLLLAGPLFGQQMVLEKTAEPPAIRVRVEYYNYARVPNSVITEGFETAEADLRPCWGSVVVEGSPP